MKHQCITLEYPTTSEGAITLQVPEGDYIGRQIEASGSFYEMALIEQYEAMFGHPRMVLDIGANLGNHSVYWGRVLGAAVLAFEPNPEIFPLLERNLAENSISDRVRAYPLACGALEQRVRIAPTDTNNCGTARVCGVGEGEAPGTTRMVVLDHWLAAHPLSRRIDLVKIDTEGYERSVLEGLREHLRRDQPVVWVETSPEAYPEVAACLADCGLLPRTPALGDSDNYFFASGKPRPLHRLRARVRASLTRSRLARRLRRLF